MSFKLGLKHVLMHCWLWPLQFRLVPLKVIDRMNETGIAEFFAALMGGALWGAFAGIMIWMATGEIQAIWCLAVAFAVTIAFAITSPFALVFTLSFAITVAVIAVFTGLDRGNLAVALTLVVAVVVTFYKADVRDSHFDFDNLSTSSFTFTSACGVTIAIAITASHQSGLGNILIWVVTLAFSMKLGVIARVFVSSEGIWQSRRQQNLFNVQTDIGEYRWLEIPVFILIISEFFIAIKTFQLDSLVLFLILSIPLATEFPFWPLMSLISLWQFWLRKFKRCNPEVFALSLPFQWQTYFYTLPKLKDFLIELGRTKGANTAFKAIQDLQLSSLQMFPARSAAFELAKHPKTILPFCGYVAISTNTATLSQFRFASPAASAVAVLAKKPENEDKQPLRVIVGDYASKPLRFKGPFSTNLPDRLSEFEITRRNNLPIRLQYALEQLEAQTRLEKGINAGISTLQLSEFRELMETFNEYTYRDIQQIAELSADLLSKDNTCNTEVERLLGNSQGNRRRASRKSLFIRLYHKPPFGSAVARMLARFMIMSIQSIATFLKLFTMQIPTELAKNPLDRVWLEQGWEVLKKVAAILADLRAYRELNSNEARRDFLGRSVNLLESLTLDGYSDYWRGIGGELAKLLADRLEQEIQQAREWLRLDIRLTQEQLPLGIQTISFAINNPTRTLAQQLRVTVEDGEGLEWHHREVKRGLLEGGYDAQLGLELETRQVGSMRIAGRLEAKDISGNVITVPFVFQVRVAEAGKPYQIPPYQPYVIGEGLGEDRTFVGREDLLHWLRGLWLQPQGKPSVALVGQRRIGKTSLLNKISRDGLPDTGLLPVLVNVQAQTGDYDFLNTVARGMAEPLGIAKPGLDRANPYPDFKDFLLGLRLDLTGRRFLLMLDEADLIPQRGLGEDLPGFLRGLMQEPQYPVLLLFCGTHALKHFGREYYSILFNTAQFRTVSYMSQTESAQVLQKPAAEWLEYDPAVLEEAFRLTKGQPLLLQSLGAKLINHFDEETRLGRKRSTFVNFNDLNAAAEDVVKQGNAAFENHWETIATVDHRFLAGLAWATDETDRLQFEHEHFF